MSNAQLDAFRREVNLNLAVGPLGDAELPVTSDDGGHPVIVAFEDEPLSLVLGRLRAVGGFATLFVKCESGVSAVSFMDERCAIPVADDDLSSPGERVGADATVGMFLAYLEQKPGGVILPLGSGSSGRPAVARDPRPVEFAIS